MERYYFAVLSEHHHYTSNTAVAPDLLLVPTLAFVTAVAVIV